jgi:hypothetical protein
MKARRFAEWRLIRPDITLPQQIGQLWAQDPHHGARSLKRSIQQMLESPLADRLLDGEYGQVTPSGLMPKTNN